MFDNNTRNEVSTNTTLRTWFGSDIKFTLGAWNDKISVKFTPSSGKDADGRNIWDRQNETITGISVEKALILYNGIKSKILPLLEDGATPTEKTVGITIGSKESPSVICVGLVKNEDGDLVKKITFFKGLNANGKANQSTLIREYTFRDEEYRVDYNEMSDSGVDEKESGEFDAFVDLLKNATRLLPVSAHVEKHSKAVRDQLSQRYGNNNGGGIQQPTNSGYGSPMNGFGGIEELPFN